MKLRKDWYRSKGAKLLLAVGANLVFLVLLLKMFTPRYEIIDDMFISMFIDGQMAGKSSYILFCNYFLATVLQKLYDLTGNAYPIYCYLQYGMLFLSFTGICYILLRRSNFFVSLAAAACLLGAFAADCYIWLTFTKTAGITVVAGVLLMLFAKSTDAGKKERWIGLIIGGGLCLTSCALRIESFAAGLALTFPLGLYELITFARGSNQRKLKAGMGYFMPFFVMLVLAVGLYGGGQLMWQKSPYKEYKEFIASAREIVDYHGEFSTYDTMPEVYDSLNIKPEICDMAGIYQSFDDTEIWSTEICRQVTEARDSLCIYPSLGEMLKTFAGCWGRFLNYRFMWGVIGLGLLWLVLAKHDRYKIAVLIGQLLVFSCMYLLFIWLDRYMVSRVDIGLFMALSASLLWQLEETKLKGWKRGLCLLLTLLAVPACAYQYRLRCPRYPGNQVYDSSYSKQQIQRMIDDGHLFLVGNRALSLYIYSPLEPIPEGYRDSLYFSGGWVVRHPQVMALLADYGLENPYRDAVNNEKVYLIPNDIEVILTYIHDYYDENARAEIVQNLSGELGINIYRLVS